VANQQALGLIEAVGLPAAIEAADAAVKAANVKLLGYELTKGGGKVTIKFTGDVAAVQAAVTAGVAAADRVGKVVSKLVIARPHDDLEKIIYTPETVGEAQQPLRVGEGEEVRGQTEQEKEEEILRGKQLASSPMLLAAEPQLPEKLLDGGAVEATNRSIVEGPQEASGDASSTQMDERQSETGEPVSQTREDEIKNSAQKTCNYCGDPACPRRKGEPRSYCIHYKKLG
jgi:microcompartment protein CcmL/EutN